MEILDCPTCGAPTEVVSSYLLDSTDGPVEHLQLRCVRRHWFAMPREMLDRYGAGSGQAALADPDRADQTTADQATADQDTAGVAPRTRP